jgi:hypothetical protein
MDCFREMGEHEGAVIPLNSLRGYTIPTLLYDYGAWKSTPYAVYEINYHFVWSQISKACACSDKRPAVVHAHPPTQTPGIGRTLVESLLCWHRRAREYRDDQTVT